MNKIRLELCDSCGLRSSVGKPSCKLIATLCYHELDEFVLQQGNSSRSQVDLAHKRNLRLFQLGLRWLKRFLATGLPRLPDFQAALSNLCLKPIVISASQNPNV